MGRNYNAFSLSHETGIISCLYIRKLNPAIFLQVRRLTSHCDCAKFTIDYENQEQHARTTQGQPRLSPSKA